MPKKTVSRSLFSAAICCLLAALLCLLLANPVYADDWTGSVNEDWHTSGNWNVSNVPGSTTAGDSASIFNSGTAKVTTNIPLNLSNLTVFGASTLYVTGSSARLTSVDCGVGMMGGTGFLNVNDGGTLTISNALNVGQSNGTGTLSVKTGGTLNVGSNLLVGYGDGGGTGTGTVNVEDGTLSVNGTLYVGSGAGSYTGTGVLNLTNNGRIDVSSGTGTIQLGDTSTNATGTLNIGTGVGTGAGIVNAAAVNGGAGGGKVVFDHNETNYYFTKDGTSSGTAVNLTGNLSVEHKAGYTVLSGTNTYTGGTTVSGGSLIINGSKTGSGDFNVVSGTLGGTGNINGTVTVESGAILSPGSAAGNIGTLFIGGSNTHVLKSGSILQIDIDTGNTPTSDILRVTGPITIESGAKLEVNVLSAGKPQVGDTFLIIQASDITGDPRFVDDKRFTQEIIKSSSTIPNGFYLTWILSSSDFASTVAGYATTNANNAAAGIDTIEQQGLTGNIPDLYNALSNLLNDPQGLANAFAQLHGEAISAGKKTGVKMQKSFLWNLPGVQDRYMNTDDGVYRGVAPCERVGSGCGSAANCRLSSAVSRWASFTGDWLERKSIGGYSGYDLRSAGVTVGMDQKMPQTILGNAFGGFAFGYDNAYQSFKTIRSSNQMDAFRVALYGGVRNGNTYADGYIGYTKDWNKTKRDVNIGTFSGTARSKFDDDIFSMGIEIGERLSFGRACLTPSIGLHYMHLSSPSVTESGAGNANLLVHSGSYDSLRMPVGARLSRNFHFAGTPAIVWTPEVRAFYVREFADASVRTSTSFAAVPGVPFYAESGNWGRNSGRFGVGLNAGLANWLSFRVNYDYEIYEHTASSEFGATLGVKW